MRYGLTRPSKPRSSTPFCKEGYGRYRNITPRNNPTSAPPSKSTLSRTRTEERARKPRLISWASRKTPRSVNQKDSTPNRRVNACAVRQALQKVERTLEEKKWKICRFIPSPVGVWIIWSRENLVDSAAVIELRMHNAPPKKLQDCAVGKVRASLQRRDMTSGSQQAQRLKIVLEDSGFRLYCIYIDLYSYWRLLIQLDVLD